MRSDLPTGTVTFLFTDVEGSTRLLEELGAQGYAAASEAHREAVRDALARHGGVEVSTHGDAFFAVFTDTIAAVRAASDAQELLADGRLRVRMGLHRGTAVIVDDTYIGMDVNRAARIADAAHGGQVVVSPTVRAALDGALVLTDLGEQRLKDLGEPVRLFQLGTATFPPLRVLHRSTLPVAATPFLGRERELAAAVALLRRADARLVTLTGPGGTGKTRLAAQAAAEVAGEYPDGVLWVPLAPLHDPSLVLPTLADAVCGTATAGGAPLERLGALTGGRALVVLDNAEHLMPGLAQDVAEALRAAPTLTLVVTSRERLRVSGELTYPVPTLDVEDGVKLFLQRATALDPSFAHTSDVDELCARLDHLPLALELAAARTSLLTPRQLLDRLGQRLDLLKGGRDADPRQQTLRATIGWSYELLERDEQEAFARLSVFAGGCTVEAAEEVCDTDLDTLESLLDKSLLRRRETDRGTRLWMLETIREFAAERLADARAGDEADEVRARHLDLYMRLARDVYTAWEAGPGYALDRIEAERDNLRRALGTAMGLAPESALDLAGMLGVFWTRRGAFEEGRRSLAEALDAAPDAPPSLRARALSVSGSLAFKQGDLDDADRLAGEGLALARSTDDLREVGHALNSLGVAAWYRGRLDDATDLLTQAADIYHALGRRGAERNAMANLASVANARGDHHGAIRLLREVLAAEREEESESLANTLNNLGLALEAVGETAEARQSFEEAVAIARVQNLAETIPYALASLAHLLVRTDPSEAGRLYDESLMLFQEMADLRGIAYCLDGLATLALEDDDAPRAAKLLAAAAVLRTRTGVALDSTEQVEVDTAVAGARERLGEESFEAAWSDGARLELDDAVALALAPSAAERSMHA